MFVMFYCKHDYVTVFRKHTPNLNGVCLIMPVQQKQVKNTNGMIIFLKKKRPSLYTYLSTT